MYLIDVNPPGPSVPIYVRCHQEEGILTIDYVRISMSLAEHVKVEKYGKSWLQQNKGLCRMLTVENWSFMY